MRPLAVDLFSGLHGWSKGLNAAGYYTIGVDIEDMSGQFGEPKPPNFSLLIQNVLTLHGSQFRGAALIVASPPCQAYSYMAMPWSRGKAKAAAIRADETGGLLRDLTALFDACFRIQREACEAAGRHIPMVVENVRGAQPWVGRARWNFGSFYIWGDVPALMPATVKAVKVPGMNWAKYGEPGYKAVAFNDEAIRQMDGRKVPGFRFDGSGRSFQSASVAERRKGVGSGAERFDQNISSLPSGSNRRKAASAKIAKIPFDLSHWIARAYLPRQAVAA